MNLASLSGKYHDACPLYIAVGDGSGSNSIGSSGGEHVVICARGSVIQVVSAATGSLLATFTGHKSAGSVTCFTKYAATSSGIEIVSASNDGLICIWDLGTCKASIEYYLDGFNGTIYDLFVLSPTHPQLSNGFGSELFATCS